MWSICLQEAILFLINDWCIILISSLQVHNETYDGFRRLSATFEELEERVNASDTDDEDVDDNEDIR